MRSSYPFTISNADTAMTGLLPYSTEATPITDRITPQDGHFVLHAGTANQLRIRLYGTEIAWGAQFMDQAHARRFSKHLRKLGFNAIRFIVNDYNYGLVYSDAKSSFNLYQPHVANFDTLLYELKQQGIYTFLTLRGVHSFVPAEGVINSDSGWVYGIFRHFYDARARQLYHDWAKTLLTHVNPLTGIRLADDPSIASIELENQYYSLTTAWRYGYINFKDQADVYPNGSATITYNESRHLDTLFSQYLLKKYGSEGALAAAYAGPAVNGANIFEDGSFEDIGSSAWTFIASNGASGGTATLAGGVDSQYNLLVHLKSLSVNPTLGDAYITNTSVRLKQDSLYEFSFWARVKYSSAAPALVDTIYPVFYDVPSYAVTFVASVPIDTTWRKYTYTIRAIGSDAQDFRIYFGAHLCDLQFDAISIRRIREEGLRAGEHLATSSIARVPFASPTTTPFQRIRDLGLFYDSLQQAYFNPIHAYIRDSIKSAIMVNNYCPTWWGTYLDAYANRTSDYAGGGINHDYAYPRTGTSDYICIQNSLTSDVGNSVLGTVEAQALEGKPFVMSSYLVPFLNQQCQEIPTLLSSYASLQDWDAIFFSYWGTASQVLDSDYAFRTDYYSIAGNDALLSMFPSSSKAFRDFRIAPSSVDLKLTHTDESISLTGLSGRFIHPFGVPGNLSTGIGAMYKVRQSFSAPNEKLASEYPYNRTTDDTAVKVSETSELTWDGQRRWMTAHTPTYSAAVGYFLFDTLQFGPLSLTRDDANTDLLSMSVLSMDTATLATTANLFLTIGSRSQNTGWVWDTDSLGIGKHYGTDPVLMSAQNLQCFLRSDSMRVVVHPLDSSGMPTRRVFDAVHDLSRNQFAFVIDQTKLQSPWYWIEMTNAPDAVEQQNTSSGVALELSANPVVDETVATVQLSATTHAELRLYDDLGRERMVVLNGEVLPAGAHKFLISTRTLVPGHYILRLTTSTGAVTTGLNVVR